MARVRDVMHKDVASVDAHATVLEAARVMNEKKSSGAVVRNGERVVGVVSDRRLLTTFFFLNKPPGEVPVSEVMAPLYRIQPDATLKGAARKMVEHGITRLGVFDGDTFLGWVTLSDLSRQFGKRSLFDVLTAHEEAEGSEFLCSNCRSAFMRREVNADGVTLDWECPKCGYRL